MKRFTSLMLTLLFAVTTFAQTLPATDKSFTITTNGRGGLAANNDATACVGFNDTAVSSEEQKNFAFVQYDGNVYLYNVWAKKFMQKNGTLSATLPIDNIQVTNLDGGNYFFKYDESHVVNLGGESQLAINSWGSSTWGSVDAGNTFILTEVADFDPAEALAVFSNVAEVTYNFVYEGVILATQTETVSKGEAYPDLAVPALPLGYVVTGTKPDGTVSGNETVTIALSIDNNEVPFAFVEDGTPTTWYYAQMHAYGGYHWFIAPKDGAVATQDHKFAANETDAHLWGFVGTVEDGFKMVNKATGEAIKSENSGVAAMASVADATAFIAMGSKAGGQWFCMKNPEGNYLNSQGSASATDFVIKHWSDNDNGSSFLLTEYVDEDVTVNVSELGWATKYFGESVHVPAGVEAYIITGTNESGYVVKEQIAEGEVIPANTGVLLYSEEAAEYEFAKTVSEYYTLAGNLLNGSVEKTYVEGEAYVLANHSTEGLGFYKAELNKDAEGNEGTTHFTNNAGKAYLVLPAASETVAFYGLDWEGTTGVEKVEIRNEKSEIYDLTGRRVEAITAPGIYVVNGKKVLVK